MDCSMPGSSVLHCLTEFAQIHVHWVSDASNHLILCCPFSSCLQFFPASGSFSNESTFHIRWPKYWHFNFSISPSNEYSEFISFRIDWLDLLAGQGTLKSLLQHHGSKASNRPWGYIIFFISVGHMRILREHLMQVMKLKDTCSLERKLWQT